MRDIASDVRRWTVDGTPISTATVVRTHGSAPREVGAVLAVTAQGEVTGSVSGGCVEGAVAELAGSVLAGETPQLVTYGISDEQAFSVGLTCGGTIEVFVNAIAGERLDVLSCALDAIDDGRHVALATVVSGTQSVGSMLCVTQDAVRGSLGSEGLDAAVTDDARGLLANGETRSRRYGPEGQRRVDDVRVFIESFSPRPRMIVFGAIDFAAALAEVGSFLGYRVTVCDARRTFATRQRFPAADEVVVEWPHRYLERTVVDQRTVLCVLTHDPKFDVPLLEVALRTPAWYVGAMGSRRTHESRLAQLRERGVGEGELASLRSPIGLDLGARTPAQTAISIAAEIIALQWQGTGRPLRDTAGAIHHDTVASS